MAGLILGPQPVRLWIIVPLCLLNNCLSSGWQSFFAASLIYLVSEVPARLSDMWPCPSFFLVTVYFPVHRFFLVVHPRQVVRQFLSWERVVPFLIGCMNPPPLPFVMPINSGWSAGEQNQLQILPAQTAQTHENHSQLRHSQSTDTTGIWGRAKLLRIVFHPSAKQTPGTPSTSHCRFPHSTDLSYSQNSTSLSFTQSGNHVDEIRFFVIEASWNPLVLGHNRLHNMNIDWEQNTVTSWSTICHQSCLRSASPAQWDKPPVFVSVCSSPSIPVYHDLAPVFRKDSLSLHIDPMIAPWISFLESHAN